jgi:hypothetical protein
VFEAGDDLAFGNLSDTSIDSKNVFQINAVYSAVSLIADTISTLPLDCFIRIDGQRRAFRPKPEWVEQARYCVASYSVLQLGHCVFAA